MTDELLDVIDENNQVLRQEMKAVVHARGLRHRVSAVLLKNDRDEYLITKAADFKVEAGGLYHSSAGHVLAGESYRDSALRELQEETGILVDRTKIELACSYWFEKEYPTRTERERFEVFLVNYKEKMGPVRLNEEHYGEQWLTGGALQQILSNDPERLSAPLRMTCERIFRF